MPGKLVRLKSRPQDDLSTRADFLYELSRRISRAAVASLDESGLKDEYSDRARIRVQAIPSLSGVEIEVDVDPIPDTNLTEEDTEEIHQKVSSAISGAVSRNISDALQGSIEGSRSSTP
ncbi:MAG TPA: hypothetical protein VLA34_04235 [Candidatus Krumholzibacterium sp.]|nr:hypothetical protein [Candidatus Krumholzibacterium sp.]